MRPTTPEKSDLRTMFAILLIGSVVLFLISLTWQSWNVAYSLGLGALVGGLNFYLLVQLVRILLGQKQVSRHKTIGLFLLKILILFGIIGLILLKGHVSPMPFLIGVSNGPITLLLFGLCMTLRGSH